MGKVSEIMVEIDVLTSVDNSKLSDLASEFNIKPINIIDGDQKLKDFEFMSSKENYLLFSKLRGDFKLKLEVTLFDQEWFELEEILSALSKKIGIFACERYDQIEETPWDYYLFKDGCRTAVQILDGEEMGNEAADFISILID